HVAGDVSAGELEDLIGILEVGASGDFTNLTQERLIDTARGDFAGGIVNVAGGDNAGSRARPHEVDTGLIGPELRTIPAGPFLLEREGGNRFHARAEGPGRDMKDFRLDGGAVSPCPCVFGEIN